DGSRYVAETEGGRRTIATGRKQGPVDASTRALTWPPMRTFIPALRKMKACSDAQGLFCVFVGALVSVLGGAGSRDTKRLGPAGSRCLRARRIAFLPRQDERRRFGRAGMPEAAPHPAQQSVRQGPDRQRTVV